MTDEAVELVDEWVAKVKPAYPIVILKNDAFETALAVRYLPTAAVIGPDGRLVYAGGTEGADGALEHALAKAAKGSVHPKPLTKAILALRGGDALAAYVEACKVVTSNKLTGAALEFAQRLRGHLESEAADALSRARADAESGWLFRARSTAESLAEATPPYPCSPDAVAFIASLAELPGYAAEIDGGELFAAATKLERTAAFTKAFKTYQSVVKQFPGTKIATHASEAARRLVVDGMPGFSPACNKCQDARRACAKHREEMKL